MWAVPACALAVSVLMLTANAQRGKGGGGGTQAAGGVPAQPAPPATQEPFTLGSYTWPSKQAFIDSGARCGTPAPTDLESLVMEQAMAASKASGLRRNRSMGFLAANVNIPVVVHVITDTAGNGNISDTDVVAGIDMMNSAFAGTDPRDPAFKVSAQTTANVPFRFVLQNVNRVVNDSWFQLGFFEEIAMKTALRVGGPETLNIYTCDLGGGLLGFATFPVWYAADPLLDGVVVNYQSWINGAFTGYNLGDTTVHEVGHWMGLFHTFQGSCIKPGDSVTDTPAEAFPYFGTPDFTGYPDTCTIIAKWLPQTASPGRDPIENFMDYSDDVVMHQFTLGQSNRMQKLGKIYRNLF
jgi:hypothetical protein